VIAQEHGARVVAVNFRQIAATRNAGARVAAGLPEDDKLWGTMNRAGVAVIAPDWSHDFFSSFLFSSAMIQTALSPIGHLAFMGAEAFSAPKRKFLAAGLA